MKYFERPKDKDKAEKVDNAFALNEGNSGDKEVFYGVIDQELSLGEYTVKWWYKLLSRSI